MRNAAKFWFLALAMTIAGCGGKDEKEKSYMSVGGTYCMHVEEVEDTCSCDGPRDFPQPVAVTYQQNARPDGSPSDRINFTGGGISCGARLDTGGYLKSDVENYEAEDPSIDRILYDGKFTGTSDEAVIATYHETVGPDEGGQCAPGRACYFRIEYHDKYCCGGDGGYNVIRLSGRKGEGCAHSNIAGNHLPFSSAFH